MGRGETSPTGSHAEPLAFEEFFEHERVRLFRVLCLVTGSRHEAEEIAQDAFLRMWERWDRIGSIEDPAGYLHRTAMNEFRKRYRRTKLAARKVVGLAPAADVFEATEARLVVAQALRSLSPRQRAAVVLTELLDVPAPEAGRILGIRASTVRALGYQAREALRRRGGLGDE